MTHVARWGGATAIAAALVAVAAGQSRYREMPGLEGYTPSKIEWLALVVQVGVGGPVSSGYTLNVIQTDYETLTIRVRYLPTARKASIDRDIETAKQVISITARSYGWDRWVKVKEDVQPQRP